MASWIDNMSDDQLAREVTGYGQVITRTPAQIAAYRAQQAAQAEVSQPLSSFMSQFGANLGGGSPSTGNRFESGLSDAETRLRALLDDPESIKQSGAYKFRVGQGQQALERSLGARGLLRSGNRLSELTKYGQDMASQEYDAQASRIGTLLENYAGNWNTQNSANLSKAAEDDRNRVSLANVWGNMQRTNQASSPISRNVSGFRFDPQTQWGVF